METPMSMQVLYKYGSLNEKYSEALFSTPMIYFASPADFNDPFECRPWFTFDEIQDRRDEVVESISRALRTHNPQFTPENAKAHAASIYLEGRHHNPKTLEGIRQAFLAILKDKIGLYCLSKNNNNILMWSHYSDNHKGYCLEFEATDTTRVFGEAQKVKYSPGYPDIVAFSTPNEEQVNLIFLTKFIGWSYEEEWRIIDHRVGPGAHAYPAELLRGVIFGLRMSKDNRAKIRAWIKKRGCSVKFYEAIQSDRQFKIDIIETK